MPSTPLPHGSPLSGRPLLFRTLLGLLLLPWLFPPVLPPGPLAAAPEGLSFFAPREHRTPPQRLPVHEPEHLTFSQDTVRAAAVSGDGRWLAYIAGEEGFGVLWLCPLGAAGVGAPRKLETDLGDISAPALSYDGTALALVGTVDDAKGDVYLLDLRRGPAPEIQRLTGAETEDGAPTFSPDGTLLFFHRVIQGERTRRLACVALSGEREVRPVEVGGDGAYPALSPDGRACAFVSLRRDPEGDIFLLDLDTHDVTPLTSDPGRDLQPAWARDGRSLYFVHIEKDGTTEIIQRLPLDRGPGKPSPQTSGTVPFGSPLPTEGGLLLLSSRTRQGNLYRLPLEGEIPAALSAEGQMALARALKGAFPPQPNLEALAYEKVLERWGDTRKTAAEAAYALGRLSEDRGWAERADKAFRIVVEGYGDVLPEACLSRAALTALRARKAWEASYLESERQAILRRAGDDLDALAAGLTLDTGPEVVALIEARAGILHARLLKDLRADPASLLTAVALLDRVLDPGEPLPPRDLRAEAMLLRADCLAQMGGTEDLAGLYRKVLEAYEDVETWPDLAVSRILDRSMQGTRGEALGSRIPFLQGLVDGYRKTLPRLSMGAQNRIGDLSFRDGEWTRAKDAYRQVLEGGYPPVTTQTAAARLALAEILYREERFRQALDLYETEMAGRPWEDRIYRLARRGYLEKSLASGEYLCRIGETAEGRRIFLDLIREDYSLVRAHRGYIRCTASLGEIPLVLSRYREEEKRDPGNPVTLYALGLATTYLEGRPALLEARGLLERALEKTAKIPYVPQTLGYTHEVEETVYGVRGGLEKAMQAYLRAFFLSDPNTDPNNAAHLALNIGNVHFLLGQYGTALQYYKKRHESGTPFDDPDTETLFYLRFGQAAFHMGDRRVPIEAYGRALTLLEERGSPKKASEIFGALNRRLQEGLLAPMREDRNRKKAALSLMEAQAELNDRAFEAGTLPVGPLPDPGFRAYREAMAGILDREARLLEQAKESDPGQNKKEHEALKGLLDAARKALAAPEGLLETRAETLNRLGLAFHEAGDYSRAVSALEASFRLNEALGLKRNLAVLRRGVACATYLQAGTVTGEERERLLLKARDGFTESMALVRAHGTPDRTTRTAGKGALLRVGVALALDETRMSEAMYGFSPEQEVRLSRAFLSRIALELGERTPAKATLEKELAPFPVGSPVADRDLHGASLLRHRMGHLAFAGKEPMEAFEAFRESARLALQAGNPVSASLNCMNMGYILRESATAHGGPPTQGHWMKLLCLDREVLSLVEEQGTPPGAEQILQAYDNAMASFYLEIPIPGTLEGAAAAQWFRQAASRHLERASAPFSGSGGTGDPRTPGLLSAIHLNRAALALQTGSPEKARRHFEEALTLASGGRFPGCAWRALLGLGRYQEALAILETMPVSLARCRSREITEGFRPMVRGLLDGGSPEEALSFLERLSERERFQRMAPLVWDGLSQEDKVHLRETAPRLQVVRDLKDRLHLAGEPEKGYLRERLAQEQALLARSLGEGWKTLPRICRIGRTEAFTHWAVVLLARAAEAEEEALSPGGGARAHGRGDPADAYWEALGVARKEMAGNEDRGLLALFGPDPADAEDLSLNLPPGKSCLRILSVPGERGEGLGLRISAEGVTPEPLPIGFDGAMGLRDTVAVLYEDPLGLPFQVPCPLCLNGRHFLRGLEARRPLREKRLRVPRDTALDPALGEVLLGAHSIAFEAPLVETQTLPTRPGETPAGFLALEGRDGRPLPLLQWGGGLESASLVVAPSVPPGDLYGIVHALSLFGVPTVLCGIGEGPPGPFVERFFDAYRNASAFEAFVVAAQGPDKGIRWLFTGHGGLAPEAARAMAERLFADYVEKGTRSLSLGQPIEALAHFTNALGIANENEAFRRYRPDLYRLARDSAYGAKRFPQAATYGRRLVEDLAVRQPDSRAHAEALATLGLVLAHAERFPEAVSVLEEALEILRDLELAPEQMKALMDLGIVLETVTDYPGALRRFEAAAALGRSLDKKDLLARQLRGIGRIYDLRLSRFARARVCYGEALRLYEALGDREGQAQCHLDLGRCGRLLGNFEEADKDYREALDLLGDDPKTGRLRLHVLQEQTNNAWFQARYQEAFDRLGTILETARERDWPQERVMALNTSGLLWWTLGDPERALRDLERALEEAKPLTGRRDETATTCNNLGLVCRDMGRYDQAIVYLEAALAIDRDMGSTWGTAYSLRNLGMTYLRMGQAAKALPLLEEALDMASRIGDAVNGAKAALALGEARETLGDEKKAEEAFDLALEKARSLLLQEVAWRACHGLARLRLEAGKRDGVRDLLTQAVSIIEGMRAAIRIDHLRDGFVGDRMGPYEALVLFLMDQGETGPAFDMAERSRGRNLIDLLGTQRLSLQGTLGGDLYARQKALAARIEAQKTLLAQAETRAEKDVYAQGLATLEDRHRDLLLEIQRARPELSTLLTVDPLGLRDIQGLLRPGMAFLAYYVTPREVISWFLTRERVRSFRTPVLRETLQKTVMEYRRRMQNLEPLGQEAMTLDAWLLGQVRPHLGDCRVLGIIPHGVLHYLSFGTLTDGRDHLVERLPLFYLPSASVYRYTSGRRHQGGPPKETKVLAIGNPDLKDQALALPFAEHEVAAMAWNFPEITVLEGDRATERWVVENISRFGIIHIASHGAFDPINPLFSSIRLARDAQDDGDLRAVEVFGLDINADLVVLSACQTGLGRVGSGDEIIGLNRAFLYAGTHTLISSLWRISDVSTAIGIKAFYRHYSRHTKAESLRRAILHVKTRYPHPGYWGALVLTGDDV